MTRLPNMQLCALLVSLGMAGAQAADIRDTACKTTAQCQAEANA